MENKWEKYSCELSSAKKQFQANSLDVIPLNTTIVHHVLPLCPTLPSEKDEQATNPTELSDDSMK